MIGACRRHPDSCAIAKDVVTLVSSALSHLSSATNQVAADALIVRHFTAFINAVEAQLLLADRYAYVVTGVCHRVAAIVREEATKRTAGAKTSPTTASSSKQGESSVQVESPALAPLSEAAKSIRDVRAAAAAALAGKQASASSASCSHVDVASLPLSSALRDAVADALVELQDEIEAAVSSVEATVSSYRHCRSAAQLRVEARF